MVKGERRVQGIELKIEVTPCRKKSLRLKTKNMAIKHIKYG